jgi:hypothetical protein
VSVFQTIGYFTVVIGTGLAIAAHEILAAFGFYVFWKCFCRGAEVIRQDLKDGQSVDEVLRRVPSEKEF